MCTASGYNIFGLGGKGKKGALLIGEEWRGKRLRKKVFIPPALTVDYNKRTIQVERHTTTKPQNNSLYSSTWDILVADKLFAKTFVCLSS